jgi:hypothetical protein
MYEIDFVNVVNFCFYQASYCAIYEYIVTFQLLDEAYKDKDMR